MDTQTCDDYIEDLAFFTSATLSEIMKELKNRGQPPGAGGFTTREEIYGLEEAPRVKTEREDEKFDVMKPEPSDRKPKLEDNCCDDMERLQKQIDQLKVEKAKLTGQIDCTEYCADILQKLKDLEASYEKLKKEAADCKAEKDRLNAENDRLNATIKEQAAKLTEFSNKVAKLEKDLEKNIKDTSGMGKDLAQSLNLVKQISDIQVKNQQLTGAVNALNSRGDQEIIDDLRRKLAECEAKNKKCQEDNEKLQKEIKAKDAQLENLQKELKAKDAELDKLQKDLKAKDAELDKLQKDLKAKDAELDKLQKDLKAKDAELDKLQKDLKAKDAELDKLQKDLKAKDAELDKLQKDLKAKDSELDKMKAEKSKEAAKPEPAKPAPPAKPEPAPAKAEPVKPAPEDAKPPPAPPAKAEPDVAKPKPEAAKPAPAPVEVVTVTADAGETDAKGGKIGGAGGGGIKPMAGGTGGVAGAGPAGAKTGTSGRDKSPTTKPSKSGGKKPKGETKEDAPDPYQAFVADNAANMTKNIKAGAGLEKELRQILDAFIQECGFCFCKNSIPKSKFYAICHKILHHGIQAATFRELLYLHKKIYLACNRLHPGCLLNMILTESNAQDTDIDGLKCCSCKSVLCCNNSEEMLKDKVCKLERDIEMAKEYLDNFKTHPQSSHRKSHRHGHVDDEYHHEK